MYLRREGDSPLVHSIGLTYLEVYLSDIFLKSIVCESNQHVTPDSVYLTS